MSAAPPILIITFQFPPLGGVGTKRMVKFSKYLARKGHKVHVVTVPYDIAMPNTYAADLDAVELRVHRIPSGCPHNYFCRKYPRTLTGRALSIAQSGVRFSLRSLLYWNDYAQRWGRHLVPYCGDLIRREGLKRVLATGAPFSVNYWAARVKEARPEITLVNDYRDLWNDDPAMRYPTPIHRRLAERMEQRALDGSDWVTATTDQQVEILRRRCGNPATRFALIPNGFDPDDEALLPQGRPASGKFRMVYTGNISNGRDIGYLVLLEAIQRARRKSPDFARDFEILLFGDIPRKYIEAKPELVKSGNVVYKGMVSSREALQQVANGFLGLLINSDHVPYAGSSKIYEYFSVHRPIYAITPPGWIDSLVTRYGLGTSVRTHDVEGQTRELLAWHTRWMGNPNFKVAVSDELRSRFEYPTLVDSLLSCWEGI